MSGWRTVGSLTGQAKFRFSSSLSTMHHVLGCLGCSDMIIYHKTTMRSGNLNKNSFYKTVSSSYQNTTRTAIKMCSKMVARYHTTWSRNIQQTCYHLATRSATILLPCSKKMRLYYLIITTDFYWDPTAPMVS